jgi:hypothetical protein
MISVSDLTKIRKKPQTPFFLYLVLFFGLYRSDVFAQQHEPELVWQTFETPHFYIHFPKGFEDLGKKI